MVGDEALGLAQSGGELPDAAVALGKLAEEPPAQRVAGQRQEWRRLRRGFGLPGPRHRFSIHQDILMDFGRLAYRSDCWLIQTRPMLVTIYGVCALTFMMSMYALERRNSRYIVAFALGCLLSSADGFLSGAWPFGDM